MADGVGGTFEGIEVDHERDGEWSAMSARDDGEVGVVVDMVREETSSSLRSSS